MGYDLQIRPQRIELVDAVLISDEDVVFYFGRWLVASYELVERILNHLRSVLSLIACRVEFDCGLVFKSVASVVSSVVMRSIFLARFFVRTIVKFFVEDIEDHFNFFNLFCLWLVCVL